MAVSCFLQFIHELWLAPPRIIVTVATGHWAIQHTEGVTHGPLLYERMLYSVAEVLNARSCSSTSTDTWALRRTLPMELSMGRDGPEATTKTTAEVVSPFNE